MLYLGIGNAGSKILSFVHDLTFVPGAPVPEDANELRFMFGDADSNNSVVYKVRANGLIAQPPPRGVRLLRLDRFWSGGCGVYHTIGELLTETAEDKHVLSGEIEAFAQTDHATIVISAGGGTGGGVGGELARLLADHPTRNVRVFAILPETDQFKDGKLEISGPDSFQLASAGRFLTRFLNDEFRAYGGQRAQHDLFILSNSYLTCLPVGVAVRDAVDRVNRFIFNTLLLLPDIVSYGARQRLVAFGHSWGRWSQLGGRGGRDPDMMAQDLVTAALKPLQLDLEVPCGLSALPTDLASYNALIPHLLRLAAAPLGVAPEPLPPDALPLLYLFRKCRAIDCYLYVRPGTASNAETEQLRGSVSRQFQRLVGTRLNNVVISPRPLPARALPSHADLALLVLIDGLPVEEVHRMVAYYAQTAFPWSGGSVTKVAQLIQSLLLARPEALRPPTNINAADPIRDRITGQGDCRLEPGTREVYTPHFWGNVDDLKNKVLQSLDRSEDAYDNRLLNVDHLAGALWYMRKQSVASIDVDGD